MRPGRKRGLQIAVQPFDQTLGLRVGRLADRSPSRPACRGTPDIPRSAPARRARHRPTAPSPSQTNTRGTAPSPAISRHQPAYRSSRSATAPAPPTATASSRAPSSTPAAASPSADCPNPTGNSMSGNHKSHCAISPASYTVREAGSGGRYTGRNSATRADNVRIERGQPIRSAITVAGIVGIRPQQLPDPRLDLIDHRPRRLPLILRRTHHWPTPPSPCSSNTHHPGDLLDRHPPRPMQPADLSPVLHAQHPLPPRLD